MSAPVRAPDGVRADLPEGVRVDPPAGVATGAAVGDTGAGAPLVAVSRRLLAAADAVPDLRGWSGPAAAAAADAAGRLRAFTRWWADDVRAAADLFAGAGGAGAPGGVDAVGGPGSAGSAGGAGAGRVAGTGAGDADARWAAALDALGRPPVDLRPDGSGGGRGGAGPASAPGEPPVGSPAAVASWWAGLDPAAREQLRRERPDLVGGLDGLPAAERDRANRVLLARHRDTALAQERAALVGLAVARTPVDLVRAGVALAEVHRRLARLTSLGATVDVPGRTLLALDVAPGRAVTAAVATGDVDTARDVAVLTPGFTADVRDLPDALTELEGVAAAAGPSTAAVAWYGYEAPQWAGLADPRRTVASGRLAERGGARLAGFLGGIDAARGARGGAVHLTAVGHSYGSLTTARAVAASPAVDDAVYLGSPGLGGAPPGPPGHVWVGEAAGDAVADLGWFGPDPNRVPGVGGLSTAAGPEGTRASHGHTDYLRAGTTSARNVAAVVGGRPDAVVADHGVGVGDRLRALLG